MNTNGLISFLVEVSQFTPDAFPLAQNRRLIAAFWADVDTRMNSGRIYYRETTNSEILQRGTDDVRRAFVGLTRFSATWVFVASWHNVTYFGGSSNTSVRVLNVLAILICFCVCICACVNVNMYMCMYECMRACVYACMHEYRCVRVCGCACVFACMHVTG